MVGLLDTVSGDGRDLLSTPRTCPVYGSSGPGTTVCVGLFWTGRGSGSCRAFRVFGDTSRDTDVTVYGGAATEVRCIQMRESRAPKTSGLQVLVRATRFSSTVARPRKTCKTPA